MLDAWAGYQGCKNYVSEQEMWKPMQNPALIACSQRSTRSSLSCARVAGMPPLVTAVQDGLVTKQ